MTRAIPDYDAPHQSGRYALVTGANSGLGFEAACRLAAAGADVVLGVRNRSRGEQALQRIRSESPQASLTVEHVDLADLDSVSRLSQRLLDQGRALDLLVNNAGLKLLPQRSETADGFEAQLGVNFLGHFSLTAQLLPLLSNAEAARVVSLGSIAARFGKLDWADPQKTKTYRPMMAYGQSKRACMVFAAELQRRATVQGLPLISTAAHPGYSVAESEPSASSRSLQHTAKHLNLKLGTRQLHAQGVLPILYAATSPNVQPGGYYGPRGFGHLAGPPGPTRYPAGIVDPETGRRLWRLAEELTAVSLLPE